MDCSDSWEEAIEDKIELKAEEKPANKKAVDIKIETLCKLLWCMKELLAPIEKPSIEERIDLHIKEKLEEHVSSLKGIDSEVSKSIALFKLLLLFNIPTRIYFVLSRNVECFIETEILNKIVQHHKKYAWCVVSIDGTLRLKNQSYHFSTSMKHHSAVKYAVHSFGKFTAGRDRFGLTEEMFKCFDELDNSRMNEIPRSICKFKKHPRYVTESVLRWNQCIYPRRPVFGYFKGEAVYSRDNVVLLKTREQLYKLGKVISSQTPYRIVKREEEVRLYAPWQTDDLVVEGFSESMYQDFFHPNFIPKGCVYINNQYAKDVAYLIGFPHRICFCGFSGRLPVNKGIFLEKKNFYLFSNFLAEYCRYSEMKMNNERGAAVFRRWRALIRNTVKYLKIRRDLGLKDF